MGKWALCVDGPLNVLLRMILQRWARLNQLLGPNVCTLLAWLQSRKQKVAELDGRISLLYQIKEDEDLLVSTISLGPLQRAPLQQQDSWMTLSLEFR